MKRKLLVSVLASGLLLAGCSSEINATPGNVSSNIVDFSGDDTEYYQNKYQTVYDTLIDSGTANSTILDAILYEMAKDTIGYTDAEINEKGFTTPAHIQELIEDYMIDRVKSGTYNVSGLFQEEKFVLELKGSLYNITVPTTGYNSDYLILPTSEFSDIFKCDYTDYIERSVKPAVYRSLYTAKYIFDEDYASVGRAYARQVRYIKLQNIDTKKEAAITTLSKYISAFVNNPSATAADFDFDSLARIWKGTVDDYPNEQAFITNNNLYTLADQIEDEIKRIIVVNDAGEPVYDANGNYQLKGHNATNTSLESKYTGSYSYPVDWGHELALRDLESSEIVGDDLYIRSNGISELPSSITERIFSASVSRYTETVKGVNFLLPATVENFGTDELKQVAKYIHYDSSSASYYVVVVDEVHSTASLRKDDDGDLTNKQQADALNIAEILAESSTNQRDAIIHYLKESNIKYHDQDFYDYIKETYSEVFED